MPNQNQYPYEALPVRRCILRGKYRPRRKDAATVAVEPATLVLPIRHVPDSSVNGRPTVNTAVRAVMPTAAEILQAEQATRELNNR